MTPNQKFLPFVTSFLLIVDSLHKLSFQSSPAVHSLPTVACAAASPVPAIANCSCSSPVGGEAFNRVYDCLLSALISFVFQVVWRRSRRLLRRQVRATVEEDESDEEFVGEQGGVRDQVEERVLSRALQLSDQRVGSKGPSEEADLSGVGSKEKEKLPFVAESSESWQQRAQAQAAAVQSRRAARRR